MEQFNNAGSLCVVLVRKGDKALIARVDDTVAPFVVPLQHVKGETSWWHGKYFSTLDAAYEYWKEETK